MLKIVASFILGMIIGYFNHPRSEAPKDQPIQIINKIQASPPTMCPEVICETQAVKDSLRQCLYLVGGLTGQVSSLNEEKIDAQQIIQNEREEAENWKKKYTDFDCGE